jgi:hypothetical protein
MAHEHAAHRTPDDEYAETPGSSYEHTDANVWAVVKLGAWLVVTAIVVHFGVGVMYRMLIERAKVTTEQPYPLAVSAEAKLPPEPRLQAQPAAEISDFRATEEQRLHGYGWVDKTAGVVHIPIEEAMRLTIERGLPARAEEAGQPASSSMLATDSSGGRVMEKRR